MRRFGRLQDRCQNLMALARPFLREKFSSNDENPHGFGYFAPYRADLRSPGSQRRTVTLSVPTLPLLSKERSEIVCSPGASGPKSTV